MAKFSQSNLQTQNLAVTNRYGLRKSIMSLDAWYGPWNSLDDLNAAIVSLKINPTFTKIGVITVAIWNEDKSGVTEYWNPDASTNFVIKTAEADNSDIDLSGYVTIEKYNEVVEKLNTVEALLQKYEDRFTDNEGNLSEHFLALDETN